MLPRDYLRMRRAFVLAAVALVGAAVGFLIGTTTGVVLAGTALGMSFTFLAVGVAVRWPGLTGAVPGVLVGMAVAVFGMGWRHLSSWSGLIGGLVALGVWRLVDKRVAARDVRETAD